MSYSRWREESIAALARAGIPLSFIRLVLREAHSHQRRNELETSVPMSEEEARELEHQDSLSRGRIARALMRGSWREDVGTIAIHYSGDPRGAPITIEVTDADGIVRSWGIPARGFDVERLEEIIRAAEARRRLERERGESDASAR